ncbi:MAG TPA: hypothetical protein VJT50_01630 [Pyrinomonadaceae bacterium]|nr:hypothetical protein [Pyrinomonadaceae bacterium]
MEPENTTVAMQPDSPQVSLDEPHFVDEATVLSARPVVPLDEVPDKSRLSRGWLLAGTIVGAMLLGGLGSALYVSLFSTPPPQTVFDSDAVVATASGEVSMPRDLAPIQPDLNTRPTVDLPDEDTPVQPAKASESAPGGRRPVARRVDVLTEPLSREERKAARRLAKEQRREQSRRARDLTRITEIFEGTQRP